MINKNLKGILVKDMKPGDLLCNTFVDYQFCFVISTVFWAQTEYRPVNYPTNWVLPKILLIHNLVNGQLISKYLSSNHGTLDHGYMLVRT